MIRQLNIRQLTEEKEESLSPFAVKSKYSRGRLKYEEPCPIRTVFQRDRDRIIHSKAFRRLKHKTQVFIAPLSDHYVTRLTHTLEVAQIARTISRALNLNEDLTEAIALGHDLGHTPFGHVGEEVLDELFSKGFRHNEQSLRVVDLLEKDGQGLNLTWEVRDGILNHSKTMADVMGQDLGKPSTFEGQVCKISDAIAYINHDIGDAIRAGIISEGDLPLGVAMVLGLSHSQRINTMVCDIIEFSWGARGTNPAEQPTIGMSAGVLEATNNLREFLFNRVYSVAREEADKAREVVRKLYKYFNEHPDKLPPEYQLYSDVAEQRVVDYIAGMTDQYALRMAEDIKKWGAKEVAGEIKNKVGKCWISIKSKLQEDKEFWGPISITLGVIALANSIQFNSVADKVHAICGILFLFIGFWITPYKNRKIWLRIAIPAGFTISSAGIRIGSFALILTGVIMMAIGAIGQIYTSKARKMEKVKKKMRRKSKRGLTPS